MPYVLGSDLAGEVLKIGTGDHAARFAVGEHVFGHTMAESGWDNDFNAAQQYALVDARFVGRVAASGLGDDAASSALDLASLLPFRQHGQGPTSSAPGVGRASRAR